MPLVPDRTVNNVPTKQLTNFRPHARFITSTANAFSKHKIKRLLS